MEQHTSQQILVPPPLPLPPHEGGDGAPGPGYRSGSRLDRTLAALRRLPARDTRNGVLGGVCATVAHRTGLSVLLVRLLVVAAVVLAGTGVAAYLLAWILLPAENGRTHLEDAAAWVVS